MILIGCPELMTSWVPTTQHILWLGFWFFLTSDKLPLTSKYKVTNTLPFLSLSKEYEPPCKADLWDKDPLDIFWPGLCILRDNSVQDTNCPFHYGLQKVLHSFKLQHPLLLLSVDLPLSLNVQGSFLCSSQCDLQVAIKFVLLIFITLCLLCKCFCQVTLI